MLDEGFPVVDWTDPQRRYGMMKVAELQLVADIAKDMDLFISIGCGPLGLDMLRARELAPDLCIVGFEILDTDLDFSQVGITYVQADVRGRQVRRSIEDMIRTGGRTFVYCDNGWKRWELGWVSPMLKVGDIVGVHDYPGEVPEATLGFLYKRGFEVHGAVEPRIAEHACHQRFWVRTILQGKEGRR